MSEQGQSLRVVVSLREDARRRVFSILAGVSARERGRLASAVVDEFARAGFFNSGIEQHYSAADFARLVGRSRAYIVQQIEAGRIAPAFRDRGGFLIPASAGERWLASQEVGAASRLEVAA